MVKQSKSVPKAKAQAKKVEEKPKTTKPAEAPQKINEKRTRSKSAKEPPAKSPEPSKKQKTDSSNAKKVEVTPAKKATRAEGKKKNNGQQKEEPKVEAPKNGKAKKEVQPEEKKEVKKGKKVADNGKKETEKKEDKKEEKKEEDSKIVKVTKKCGAVVDSHCPVAANVHVFSSGDKTYDQTLNQSNLVHNNNKFYILQVLQEDNDANSFYFWTRWGRVGVPGQNALAGPMAKEKAIQAFESKLHDKTCKGEYTKIEISYDEEEEKTAVVANDSGKTKISGSVTLPKSASMLDNRLQNLISLIFDMKMMNVQMKEIGYDAKKMPLGKLAKSTIQQGYEVLNELMEGLKKKTGKSEYERLSSKFYSLIPHDFGFQKMANFILDSEGKLKAKLDMLQSLSDMQVATKLLDQSVSPEENLLDANYRKLECKLQAIDPKSKEYKLIEQFISDSKGSWKIELKDVFTVERKGEKERFKKEIGNRILLWHGSGIGNFVGILSQGLRIAPPEAPVSGYRFGKGIYFADMIEKSAGYCRAYNSEACALLGDVACGNFSLKYGSDSNANNLPKGTHSTLGVGNIGPPKEGWSPIEKDLQVPVGKPTSQSGGGWGHNEYIVYDIAQVRLRYLIRMKLG